MSGTSNRVGEIVSCENRWDTVPSSRSHCRANTELYDSIGRGVVLVTHEVAFVLEREVATNERRKVDDDVPTFGDAKYKAGRVHGGRNQTSIAGYDGHRDARALTSCNQIDLEASANRCIEKSESVLARLDIEEGPRLTVDTDNVTVERVILTSGGDQLTIRLVVAGSNHERNVVLALRQFEGVLSRVVENVKAGLAIVSVDGGDLEGVIVVPESTSRLTIPAGILACSTLTGVINHTAARDGSQHLRSSHSFSTRT